VGTVPAYEAISRVRRQEDLQITKKSRAPDSLQLQLPKALQLQTPTAAAVFQTAADPNGASGLSLSATNPYLSDIFMTAPHHTIETESLKVFRCFFAEGEIGGTLCMWSRISVHGATTKFCDNPFVFKNAIEKEGLEWNGCFVVATERKIRVLKPGNKQNP
jgi:hypothetical protein